MDSDRVVLAEKNYGQGLLLVGTLTPAHLHDPEAKAVNLMVNILRYAAGYNLVTNPPQT